MDKKKKLIIEIVVFILLLVCITFIYNYLINKGVINDIKEEKEVEIMEIQGSERFEQEVINENKMVFIDFYATWCAPCKMMSPIIEEMAKEYKDVKFVKIDIDNNEELAVKYNVMSIPTMIIMKNGDVTKTFVGVTSKEDIIREF